MRANIASALGASAIVLLVALLGFWLVRGSGDENEGTSAAGSGDEQTETASSDENPDENSAGSDGRSDGTSATSSSTTSVVTTTTIPARPAETLSVGPVGERVLLTFDAGADVGFTQAILDTLERNEITAAFGITGMFAEEHPDLVVKIDEAGHTIINHSYDHGSATGFSTNSGPLSFEERQEQLDLTEAALEAAIGKGGRPWYRAPYGDVDDELLAQLGQSGFSHYVRWSVDSLGWNGLTPAQIVQRCMERLEPGAIYLFHVGSRSGDAAALQGIIDGLRERNYGFATLEEMAGQPAQA